MEAYCILKTSSKHYILKDLKINESKKYLGQYKLINLQHTKEYNLIIHVHVYNKYEMDTFSTTWQKPAVKIYYKAICGC